MKYKVSVMQRLKYNDTITGTFSSLAVVQQFIETVINHFEKVEISIDVVTKEEDEDDTAGAI